MAVSTHSPLAAPPTPSHPLLALLSPEARALLSGRGALVRYGARRPVQRAGEEAQALFVLAGAAQVNARPPSGPALLLQLLAAPSLWGDADIFTDGRASAAVTTLLPTLVLKVPGPVFLHLLRTEPAFARAAAADLARRARAAAAQAVRSGRPVLERFAMLLAAYAQLCGTGEDGGVRLPPSFTQARLARELAVSRKSLQRAQAALLSRGLLARASRGYLLPRPAELPAEAASLLIHRCG